jgi:hypothetical protein
MSENLKIFSMDLTIDWKWQKKKKIHELRRIEIIQSEK